MYFSCSIFLTFKRLLLVYCTLFLYLLHWKVLLHFLIFCSCKWIFPFSCVICNFVFCIIIIIIIISECVCILYFTHFIFYIILLILLSLADILVFFCCLICYIYFLVYVLIVCQCVVYSVKVWKTAILYSGGWFELFSIVRLIFVGFQCMEYCNYCCLSLVMVE